MSDGIIRPLHVFETWRPIISGYTSRSWSLITTQDDRPGIAPRGVVTSRQFTYGVDHFESPLRNRQHFRLCVPSKSERCLRKIRAFSLSQKALEQSLSSMIDDFGADLIHVHWSSCIGRAAANIADRYRIPLVSEVRFDLAGAVSSQTFRRSVPAIESLLRHRFESHLSRSSGIIAAGPSLANFLSKTFPRLSDRIWTISNGSELKHYLATTLEDPAVKKLSSQNRIIVGTTSKMLYYEGLDLMLHAVAKARKTVPALQVLMVGSGPESANLQRIAGSLNVPVTFTGIVSPAKIASMLEQIDLFVIPRRNHTVTRFAGPIKLLEAMAAGRSIIATPIGDIPLLLDKHRGRLVIPHSVGSLADAIIDLACNSSLRYSMGSHAREFVRFLPNWNDVVDTHQASTKPYWVGLNVVQCSS